jgi:hypothetical protein
MSLSNSSRIDTIRAFDQLSHRLRNPSSRSSVATDSSTSTKDKRRRRSSSSHSSSTSSSSQRKSKSKLSKAASKADSRPDCKSSTPLKLDYAAAAPKIAEPSIPESSTLRPSRSASASSRTAVANRMSMMTISTDSTKLGEIPERKLRKRYTHDSDLSSGEYNVSPIYPMKPYRSPEPKQGFWSFLRRG